MPMDIPPSSSSDVHDVIKQEEELPVITSKSVPYHSLLVELHTLDPQHEFWTSGCRWCQFFNLQELWTVQQEVKLQEMVFKLLQNHAVRSQSLRDIQHLAQAEAEQIQDFIAGFADSGPYFFPTNVFYDGLQSIHRFLEHSHQKIKPHLKEFCLGILDRLLQGNSSTTGDYSIFAFVNVILLKLKHFLKLKPNLIAPVKKQMQILEQMLNYAPIISRKLTNLDETLQKFLEFFKPWVNTAAAIIIPYWVDENDEKPFAMVSSSLNKFNLSTLQYVEAYHLVIKALRPSNASEILLMRNTVEVFIEMILEKFIVSLDDRFDMFREAVAFWTALLVDPPKSDVEHEKLICSQTHLLIDQAKSLICLLCLGENVAERRNSLLNNFVEKVNKAKAEVRQLLVHQIPGLSRNSALKANTRERFNLLLGNLQKKFEIHAGFLPFEKHLIAIVHKELSLLRSSLMDILKLLDKHKELSDIWVQASNIAYIVDYVTDFCLASTNIPIWSNLMHLSNAIEKIQHVKTEVSKVRQNDHMYDKIMGAKLNSQHVLPARREAYEGTIKDDFKVGFLEEEKRIIDFLVAREAGRNLVAVVGMGGQGKTFLVQRVFQDIRIQYHFHKLTWCSISHAYDIKRVFRDILEGIGETVSPELYQCLTQEDLADKLRKCLMGQKYLVVLDDIWDAKAWFDLELSFPDNRNGSRILLTSRNLDVVLKMKANCSIVELHPLSHEDSWNLLQMKVFHGDSCPPDLFEIGKTVAKNCKGLPLAVVVVAGLLKNDKTVESWNQISESLKSLIASEGCMDIVELSYKHLPDYLKPCFLYLGAFREDQIIDAEELIQFWIAEGFVQSDGIKTKEVVANEYLMDLVSRSLIFVAQRSFRNGIKTCFVHDLLHQLCQIKAEEERFLLVINDISSYFMRTDPLDHSSEVLDEPSYTLNLGGSHCSFIQVQDNVSDCSLPLVVEDRSRCSLNLNDGHCRIVVGDNCHVNVAFHFQHLLPGLRTFIDSLGWLDYPELPLFLTKLKLVRVLDLPNVEVTKTSFDSITQLIHLRLLAVVCSFPIPPCIVNLLKLEVLRFYASLSLRTLLPSAVTKMPSLQHIIARECRFDYIDSYDQLVPDMSSSLLSNLETLTSVYFDDELSFKRVAQSLQNVLKLGFYCGVCFRLSSYFKRLESLKFHLRYHSRQRKVIICPSKLDFPLTIKELNLKVYGLLSSAMMSLIGKLSNLEVLKLNAKFENDKWDVEDDEFRQLKYFKFKSSSIQEWDASDESFPCLQQLLVRKCLKLRELPARFGSVTTLRGIELQDCSDSLSNSFQQIVEDQKDAGNEGLQHSISFIRIRLIKNWMDHEVHKREIKRC